IMSAAAAATAPCADRKPLATPNPAAAPALNPAAPSAPAAPLMMPDQVPDSLRIAPAAWLMPFRTALTRSLMAFCADELTVDAHDRMALAVSVANVVIDDFAPAVAPLVRLLSASMVVLTMF